MLGVDNIIQGLKQIVDTLRNYTLKTDIGGTLSFTGGSLDTVELNSGAIKTAVESIATSLDSTAGAIHVELVGSSGTPINITAGDLNVQLSDQGANPDVTRLGDGTTQVGVIPVIKSIKSDISSVAGTVTAVNAGVNSAGVQRVTVATDDKINTLLASEPMLLHGNYSSPEDGAVVYTSNATLTCSGFPFTVDSTVCNIIGVLVTNAAGTVTKYINGHNGVSFSALTNVITITGVTPFLNTDTKYRVVLHAQDKAYSAVTDTLKIIEQAPIWARYTSVETQAAYTITTSFAKVTGSIDIPVVGYKTIGFYLKLTLNQMTGIQFYVTAQHTLASTDYYKLPIQTVSSTLISINPEIVQMPDVSDTYLIKVDLDNVVPYITLWCKATADTGTDATLVVNYIKGY